MDHNTPPSVHPLVALLTVHFDTIMERDRTNRGFVHLYGVGDYWVAFEQSAYPLCHLMPSCETAFSILRPIPFRWSWPRSPIPVCNPLFGSTYFVLIGPPTRSFPSVLIRQPAIGRGTERWNVPFHSPTPATLNRQVLLADRPDGRIGVTE